MQSRDAEYTRGERMSNSQLAGATPLDYLSAERTFLAWIRTGLALMGFGFVVARFGLFLRELAINTHSTQPTAMSVWMGTALLLFGVGVNVAAAAHHVRVIGKLNRGVDIGRPSAIGITVALILAAMGLALAIYLLLMN